MARFLNNTDYSVLIRNEIKEILIEAGEDANEDEAKMLRAEDMAIAQVRSYLNSRYNVSLSFISYNDEYENAEDTRNAHLVMVVLDCTLYHLYTSIAPELIPEFRANRYQDALEWLKEVMKGDVSAELPKLTNDNGEEKSLIKISSERPNEDNRW